MASILPDYNQLHHLIREIDEADSRCVPLLLLKLKEILLLDGKKARSILIQEIWEFQFPSIILKCFDQDFSYIPGGWSTASQLVALLVECCVDCIRDIGSFLDDTVLTILQLMTKIVKAGQSSEELSNATPCTHLASIITSVSDLMKRFKSTACRVLSSKHFMQFLMIENEGISLLALSLLKASISNNRTAFDHVNESRIHNIADELAFKITATKHVQVAKVSMTTLLFLMDTHLPLLRLFTSKRYRGFKTYVVKWNNNGFDSTIQRFICILEKQLEQQISSQKFHKAAIMIQSVYRGYSTRRRLQKASKNIAKFQRIYRQRKTNLQNDKEKQQEKKAVVDYSETQRRRAFVDSRSKQLKIIKSIPARTVNKFLDGVQHEAALKIQATWLGSKTRKHLSKLGPHLKRNQSATIIQRQVRRWLLACRQKRKAAMLELLPSGLTDDRRVQLQNVITNIRERFPKHVTNDGAFMATYDQSFSMLNNHITSLRSVRRRDEHRKALLAQLEVQSEQFLSMPSLENVTERDISIYASKSAPVIVAGRKQHAKYLVDLKKPWWAKLDEDNYASMFDENLIKVSNSNLHIHDKQF